MPDDKAKLDPIGEAYNRRVPQVPPDAPHMMNMCRLALVTKDGGSGGGGSSECTWTYTVKELDDSTILVKNSAGDPATSMTPETPRFHYTEYWYAGETRTAPAGATSRYAFVAYGVNGVLHLLVCFGEIPKDEVCG